MAYRGNRRQGHRQKSSDTFPERIFRVLLLTGALWLASEFMRARPDLAAVGNGLRSVLWLPLTIGVGLLVLHFVFQVLANWTSNADPARNTFDDRRDPHFTGANAQAGPVTEVRWSSKVFAAIEWRRFEAVVETLFAQEGYETRSQLHGADGGVDIWLYSKNPNDAVSVVQCKHWQGHPVTVKELREFLGVMASHGIKRGTFATSSRYTAVAIALHWAMAALLLFMIWLGWNMEDNEARYQLHKSIGITILFLALFFVMLNVLVDILQSLFDPRIRR